MNIRKITLTNFRLYRGVNSISFNIDDARNIFIISGQNGFGKTTFLHSLLWCLYGRLMVEVDETIRKDIALKGGYNVFLASNLNSLARKKIDGVAEEEVKRIRKSGYSLKEDYLKRNSVYSVSIDFENVYIPSIPCKSLEITRYYDIIQNKESVKIKIDGVDNELCSEIGSDVFINDFILNKDIARFFFFDSERIVSLAETNTIEEKRKLNSAYSEVLGVKKYENLKKSLESVRLRFRKKTTDVEGRNKLNTLLLKQTELVKNLDSIESQICNCENNLIELRRQNDDLQLKLLREGNGVTMDELHKLEDLLHAVKEKDGVYRQKLKNFIEFAPFAISGGLLFRTKIQLEKDYQIIKSAQNVQNQNEIITEIASELLMMLKNAPMDENLNIQMQKDVQILLEKYRGKQVDGFPLINIERKEYQEFLSLFNNIITTYKIEFEHLAEDYKKNKLLLERTHRKFSNLQLNENDQLIKTIRNDKNKVESQIERLENEIRTLYENKGIIVKELSLVNKKVTELSKIIDLDDNDQKKDLVAEQLIQELNEFLYSLKMEKKYSLEKRIKNIMNSLMHKESFIGSVKVHMLDDGIDIDLYSPDGTNIRKDSLSKGEQQLYATSILKALVEESGIEFPVFIDSPLQKFDKSHSHKIISEFYPSISNQVVLFPLLHKELTKEELELMKPLVNSAFLIKNDKSYSSFENIDIESLMN